MYNIKKKSIANAFFYTNYVLFEKLAIITANLEFVFIFAGGIYINV